MAYPRLGVEAFGRHLLRSNDLDPIYVALYKAHEHHEWSTERLKRWMVAYWCFYHAGFASYACKFSGVRFWNALMRAAVNQDRSLVGGRWPRGTERRHARGAQGVAMIDYLRNAYRFPEKMVDSILAGSRDFASIRKRVKTHHLFGDWIAFKVGDMLERILGERVDFSEADVFMFKDPVKGAQMVWESWPNSHPKEFSNPKEMITTVVYVLEKNFSSFLAPPSYDRPIGLQEVETILCKWKSHMNGHYPLNNDIREIREGLKGWGKEAELFLKYMPEENTYED